MTELVNADIMRLQRQLRIERMLFQDYKRSFREFLKEIESLGSDKGYNFDTVLEEKESLQAKLARADKVFLERMKKR